MHTSKVPSQEPHTQGIAENLIITMQAINKANYLRSQNVPLRSCLVKKYPSEKFLNRLDFFAASRRIVALFNEEQREKQRFQGLCSGYFLTKQHLIRY